MPIPQLNHKHAKNQSWRASKKKYYINRQKPKARNKTKTSRSQSKKNIKDLAKWWPQNWKKTILLTVLALFLVFTLAGLITIAWISRGLPPPGQLINREIAQSTKIFDRNGETVLYEIHGDEKRSLVKLEDIPDYLEWATIAMEDKNFYKHKGVSVWGIIRGVIWQTIRGGRVQGGSTLTQQFVKNAILTSERTIKRKLKEWILAYRIEQKYSKNDILQMYLNEIPYGSTAYGVEAASQRYFGKNVKEINLPEAAVLAALPQAPSLYSPYGSNKDLLIARQHYILDLMLEQGYISEAKNEAAKLYELEFKKPTEKIIAPHFIMYIKEILAQKYGEKMIEQGGLKIYTTLDLYKQKIAEEVITAETEQNEEQYQASNAALISLDPKTGQILAMVGSRDYFNDDIDGQVNITTSDRQPGSSLKPLVYASAFLKGYTPDTILYDVVTNFSNNASKPYEPHNYDNQEHGPITIRKALAGSLNIPAVKTIYLAGVDNVLELAGDLGYSTLGDRDRFGLSLVLGGGEVKLIEHTNAYSAFAREGILHPLAAILKIEDKDGRIIEEFEANETKVIDPKIARLINDILSDNNARAYAFGERNWLTLGGRPVAAKTGTTNDYRDAWTIGYTPSIVTGVWVGNNDNSEMKRGAAGGTVAAPIWHDYMKRVLGDTPIEYFKKPTIKKTGKPVLDGESGLEVTYKIDRASGLLATDLTPESFIEELVFGEPHCLLYFVDKNNPLGEPPAKPEKDPQFSLWENRVRAWAEAERSATSTLVQEPPPTEYDNLHVAENLPNFEIASPQRNQTISEPLLLASIKKATAPRGINRAEYYLNDNLLAVNYSYPFNLEKNIAFLPNGFHNLKIKICDDINNCTTKEIEFNVEFSLRPQTDASLSLVEPSNGLAVSNIDFPLTLKLAVINFSQAAKISFYYQALGSDEAMPIAVIQPVKNKIINGIWSDAPVSGTYRLYSTATDWSDKIIISNEITITVNNIAPKLENNSEED